VIFNQILGVGAECSIIETEGSCEVGRLDGATVLDSCQFFCRFLDRKTNIMIFQVLHEEELISPVLKRLCS
jgi:hypothetical protein